MVKLFRLAVIALAVLFSSTAAPSAHAQSQITGDLKLVHSYGKCNWKEQISTSNKVSTVMGLWFLRDSKETTMSSRGMEVISGQSRTMPNKFTSQVHRLPGTLFFFQTAYDLANWDRGNKTVTLLKQSWVYTGWGFSTKVYCYGVWAGSVKYR
jgi:hypothetical protein